MSEQTKKFVAFSCPHMPLHDPDAISWVLNLISDEQPDVVVHLGDGLEANAASRWGDAQELGIDLAEEFDRHNSFLKDIRESSGPKARLVHLYGNHERNIEKPARLDKRIRGLCSVKRNQPELSGWTVVPSYNKCRKRGVWRLGQVTFAHGWETSGAAGHNESTYFADEYGLYIHGHTHRPSPVTQAMRTTTHTLRYWHANAGCLRELDPNYMEGKSKARWGQAAVVGEAVPLKSPRRGVYWAAETKVFRMYDEWANNI
jgi:predicted phosphodiesterase